MVLRIRDGSKTLKEWFGVSVASDVTLADLFSDFSSGTLDGNRELRSEYQSVFANVRVAKSPTDTFTIVQADSIVEDVVSVLGDQGFIHPVFIKTVFSSGLSF